MKAIFRSLLLSFLFVLPAQLFAQTLLAGWDFQTTTNGGTAAVVATSTPTVINAKSSYLAGFGPQAGTAGIYLDGTNGSSTFNTSVVTANANETNGAAGAAGTVNAGTGFATTTSSPAALGFVAAGPGAGPYTANGKFIVFAFNMANYKTLNVTYANYRSATGFASQTWEYATSSTGPWMPVTVITTTSTPALPAASSFGLVTLPTITGLDNTSTAYLRLTFNGATGNAGTTRLDNIQLNATALTFYSKSSGDLSVLANYGSATDGSGAAPQDFNGAGTGTPSVYQLGNRATYTLTSDLTVGSTLNIPGGSTLDLGGKTLTTNALSGTGTLTGSNTSSLVINGTVTGLSFATGQEKLKNLTLGASANLTLSSFLAIAGTGTVTLGNNSQLNTNNTLALRSDASGTGQIAALGTGATITGGATVERYLADKRSWRLIASSVYSTQTINAAWQEGAGGTMNNPNPGYGTFIIGNGTSNGFDIAGSSGSLLAYNGTVFNSVPNTNATAVSLNPGYFLFSIGDRGVNAATAGVHSATTLRSYGTVVTGTQTANITAAGYTLVGNPYPAPIDFANVTKSATVPDRFYAWDINLGTYGGYVLISNSGGTYTSVPASPSGLTSIIPSGAAIFVQSDGASAGTVTITEASKATAAGAGSFSNFGISALAKTHDIRVNLTDGTANLIDGVMASFADGYSNNVDAGDALKLNNFYENISLSRSGKQLTMERRSDLVAKDTIFVQLSGVKATTYKLQVDPADFNEPGMVAYLEDAYLHTSTKLDMKQVTNISFTITADLASYKDRFKITLTPASALLSFTNVSGTNPGKQIVVKWDVTGEDNVQQYTVEKWNGAGYTTIASVQSTLAGSYTSADKAVLPGDNTYRISAKDSYGNIMFSKSVVMKISNINANVVAFPNPAVQKQINLSFSGMPAGSYNITVTNTFGQVMQKNSMSYNGTTANKLLTADYTTGVYTVNVQSAGYNQSIKVIIP